MGKSKRLVFMLLSFLLVLTPVFSNPAFAASNITDGKKDKLLKAADLQKKQPDKAIEKRGLQGAQTKINPPQDNSKNTKTRKSKLPGESGQPAKTGEKSSKVHPVNNSSNQKGKGKYAPDEIIVKYKNSTAAASVKQKYSLKTNKKLKSIGAEVVKIPKGNSVEGLVSKLKADPNVAYAQPNYKYQRSDIPNDPLFGQLWGLNNTGQQINGSGGGVPNMDINYPDALQEYTKLANPAQVVVGVIDTGVDINHPELKDHIWTNPKEIPGNGIDDDNNGYIDDVHGWDFYNNDNSVFDPGDGDDHGTHVSGTIAAQGNNNIGITGIAPNVEIMPLKFLGPDGGYSSDAILAIEYAKSMGVKITNNSWSGGDYDQALKDAINNSGILFVAAAGNDDVNTDQTPAYPASYDCSNIISVAAIDNSGALANFSNYGYNSVDIAAPGVDILSTVPTQKEEGLAAEINNTANNYKAIFNGFGFENIIDTNGARSDALKKAMDYLKGGTASPKVLLVQDDESDTGMPNYLAVYKTMLANAGFTYDVVTVPTDANGPTLTTLNQYDIVIWFTGNAMGHTNPNLTSADLNTLDQYLKDDHKSLLLSGQDILYKNEASTFVTDTLSINETGEGAVHDQIDGTAGTIYDGSNYQLAYTQYADFITSSNNAYSKINLILPGDPEYKNAYAYYSGTSMATPHVTGVAALLASKYPDKDIATLRSIILASGDNESYLSGWIHTGKKLNAYNALTYNLENLDNDIPGTALTADSVDGGLNPTTGDTDDVYAVHLNAGETVQATLTGAAGSDFDLYLFSPDANTVNNSTNMLAYSETPGSSGESITYVAKETGTYYLDVYAYAGSGTYTLKVASGNGTGTYEDDSATMDYNGPWTSVSDSSYSNGTAHQLNATGKLNFTFVGSKIQWAGFKNADQGIADVYLDGTLVASVSLYAASVSAQQTLFEKTVPYGKHLITINWTGNYDPAARKSSTAINVDKLVVSDNLTVPTGLKVSYDSIQLLPYVKWDQGGTGGYNVYRKEKGQDDSYYKKLNDSPVATNYFYDTTAAIGTTYEYAVTAVSSQDAESAKTDPVEYTYDDQVPGVATTDNSITGSVDNANDYMDVWKVTLEAGKTYSFSFSGPAGTDFDYRLFGPSTTDVYNANALREGIGNTSEDYFTYPVDQSGTYYIAVDAATGAGQYSIQMGSKPTVNDDDISANLITLNNITSVSDFLDSYDTNDVYSVDLAAGDTITLNLSTAAKNGSDMDLYLYGPNATTMNPGKSGYMSAVAHSSQLNTSSETITYKADTAGKYYVDVSSLTGAGPYTLGVDIQKAITVTRVEDSDPNIQYTGTWTHGNNSSASGGNISYSSGTNAAVEYTFNGTGIRWIALKYPAYGIVDVYIDGTKVQSVDLFSASTSFKQVVYENLNLSDGSHTIKLVNTGTKNSAASGTFINIDAFETVQIATTITQSKTNRIEDSDSTITYTGSWNHGKNLSASGGDISYTDKTDATAEYTFYGTGIRWIALKYPAYGIVDVYIDGTKVQSVDLYSASTSFKQVVYENLNLSNGSHTIKLVNTGTKNSAASGTFINIDAFETVQVATTITQSKTNRIEDSDSTITYTGSWNHGKNSSASGGDISYTDKTDATAEYTFYGTGIRWIALKYPAYGIVDVYIDGTKVQSVDLFSAATSFKQVVYENLNLSDGSHTIKLVNTGTKNSAASGTFINIDAFETVQVATTITQSKTNRIEDSDSTITYTGSWNHGKNSSASGEDISYTDKTDASAEYTFYGTGIRWIALKYPAYGIVDVYIDGTKVQSVDLYSASTFFKQVVYENLNLSDGSHAIKLVNTSTKNFAASGTFINIDAFEISN